MNKNDLVIPLPDRGHFRFGNSVFTTCTNSPVNPSQNKTDIVRIYFKQARTIISKETRWKPEQPRLRIRSLIPHGFAVHAVFLFNIQNGVLIDPAWFWKFSDDNSACF